MRKSINANQIYFLIPRDRLQVLKHDIKLLGIAAALIACIPLPPRLLAELEKQA